MTALILTPAVLSLLVLAAHFLRAGRLELVGLVLLLLPLLGIRRWWSARLLQAALLLGAAEWVRTLYLFASIRSRAGEPVTRLVIILGSVALVALLSALLIQSGRARRWFRIGGREGAGERSAPAPP